jgi:integrase
MTENEACTEIVMVEWTPELVAKAEPPGMLAMFTHYAWEHCRPAGVDLRRLCIVARNFCAFFGLDRDPQTLKRADIRAYREHRLNQGVTDPTIRREFAFLKAAMNHELREERFQMVPHVEMPPQGNPRKRFLQEEEVARVMRQPMPHRIRMFFILAFATAARARAIEELTWDRVDFANGLIDYRVPGRDHKKKRRAIVPMSDELRRRLEAAWARPNRNPDDPYVIGRGPRGSVSCTYSECKAVMRAAGIDELGVARHVARKTFASHALQAGVPIAKVAAVLADNPTTAEKAYAFILPQHLVEVVNFRERKAA